MYLALFVTTLVVYPWVWSDAPYWTGDAESYRRVAADLADGQLDQLWFRSPGYPLLMLLTGSTAHGTRSLFLVGLILHCASVWIGGRVLDRLRFSAPAIVLFGVLASLPPFVESAAYVMTENLTEFFLVLSFATAFAWVGRRHSGDLVASGLLMAYAALVRPTYQLGGLLIGATLMILAVITPGQLRLRNALAGSLIVLAVSTLGIGGFAAYNDRHHGVFSISPGNLAYSMTTKTVRQLELIPDEYAVEREILIAARNRHLIARGSSHTADQYWPTASRELSLVTGKNDLELLGMMSKLNFLVIREAPLHYLTEVARSLGTYWLVAFSPLTYGQSALAGMAWVGLHFLWLGFFALQLMVVTGVALVSLFGLLKSWIRRRPWPLADVDVAETAAYLLPLMIIVYTMAISCVLHHGSPRYRTPTDLLILLSCFLGARMWWRWSEPVRPPHVH